MNRVILTGRLAADPELKQTQSGVSVCQLRLAVERKFKNANGKRETDWINIVAWRNTAEFCARYLQKGAKIGVEGMIQTRSYEAQDGSKRYVTEVVADGVEFCESRRDSTPTPGDADAPGQAQTNSSMPAGFVEVEDDDQLPF